MHGGERKKAGITKVHLTHSECLAGTVECELRLRTLAVSARGLRKVHLRDRLINAEDINDADKYEAILQIIRKEEQKSTWRAINRVIKDPKLGAITKVQRKMSDGDEVDLINSTDMVREIQIVTEQRFSLAESAPATNTSLRDTVGFLADTEYAIELVTGQAPLPADIDGPTKVILEEMQRLWKDT